tara:strand:- start:7121 stop:7468 length:348 start_codon:yes stop_codon:yes gene_type:complete
MTEFKINKIHDGRNMGQIDEGFPLSIWLECTKDDGSEFKGWYYPGDEWESYRIKGKFKIPYKYYFHQSKLASGKTCQRKTTPKITKMLIQLIEENKSRVKDYGILWNKIQNEKNA